MGLWDPLCARSFMRLLVVWDSNSVSDEKGLEVVDKMGWKHWVQDEDWGLKKGEWNSMSSDKGVSIIGYWTS